MKSAVMLSSLVGIASCFISVRAESSGECCVGACKPPLEKYYSIAKDLFGHVNCGECCMDPKDYKLYHFFEKNLTKANDDFFCKHQGYTEYESTPTHGFGPIKMTLDLYKKPSPSCVPVTCAQSRE